MATVVGKAELFRSSQCFRWLVTFCWTRGGLNPLRVVMHTLTSWVTDPVRSFKEWRSLSCVGCPASPRGEQVAKRHVFQARGMVGKVRRTNRIAGLASGCPARFPPAAWPSAHPGAGFRCQQGLGERTGVYPVVRPSRIHPGASYPARMDRNGPSALEKPPLLPCGALP